MRQRPAQLPQVGPAEAGPGLGHQKFVGRLPEAPARQRAASVLGREGAGVKRGAQGGGGLGEGLGGEGEGLAWGQRAAVRLARQGGRKNGLC